MSINKFNYESHAFDYLEGTLPDNLNKEMEDFLINHPKIKKELMQLKEIILKPDTTITFAGKEELLQPLTSNKKDNRRRFIFWASLAAAVLFGGMILLKVMMPEKVTEAKSPVAIEEKGSPVEKVIEPEIELVPENKMVDIVEKATVPKKEKRENNIPNVPDSKNEVVTEKPQVVPLTPSIPKVQKLNTPDEEIVVEKEEPGQLSPTNVPGNREENPKIIPQAEQIIVQQPEVEPVVPPKESPKFENQPELTPEKEIAEVQEVTSSELEAPSNPEESFALLETNLEENTNQENIKNRNKKKRRPFFPKIKEKLSKSNLTNALLPEAYSSGSDD